MKSFKLAFCLRQCNVFLFQLQFCMQDVPFQFESFNLEIKFDMKYLGVFDLLCNNERKCFLVWFMVFNATFNNIFSYIVAVSFIGGGNRSTRRKPPTCRSVNITFFFRLINPDSNIFQSQ